MNICPYICDNKTEYGYCKTTTCINPGYHNIDYSHYTYTYSNSEYCTRCLNHPRNGGSGICSCILATPIIT